MSDRAQSTGGDFWGATSDAVALERYRTLVNTVDDGIYQLDTDGRFVAVNDVILEYTGYDRDELLGEHVSIVLDDDELERIEREISDRLTGGERRGDGLEFTVRTADGETIVCELRMSLLIENGEFRGSVGIVRDITDQKRTERVLDERERQLQRERDLIERILETSPVGIQVLDVDGEISRMNDRAREILGVPDDRDTYSPADRRVYDETGRPLSIDEHPFARTLESGRRYGSSAARVWFLVRYSNLLGDDDCERSPAPRVAVAVRLRVSKKHGTEGGCRALPGW
ncbi:PAS domain-containing protein [Natrialbaceae archaeon GCM10025810]|uniref:PAS domain-containing protein n=1 Tax=Halovalidus salilacus TaxID=3075124 RepID=UPI00360BB601